MCESMHKLKEAAFTLSSFCGSELSELLHRKSSHATSRSLCVSELVKQPTVSLQQLQTKKKLTDS